MKNKRLVILLSVFAFLVLIAVLCSTVFTVRKVSVEWSTTKVLFDHTDAEIVGDVKKGESVFLVDKASIKQTLEEKYPYLKVVSLEIKFPNQLVVHASERQELFSIKVKDNSHYILDGECKVLRSATDATLNGTTPVTVKNFTFPDGTFEVSKVAEMGFVNNVLTNFASALSINKNGSDYVKNNVQYLDIDVTGYNENLEIKMRGVTVKVNKITSKLLEKLELAIATFDHLSAPEKESGVMTVYEVAGKVFAEYA